LDVVCDKKALLEDFYLGCHENMPLRGVSITDDRID